MKMIGAQRGLSYWGVMFGVILFVIVIKAATATWPVYWDNQIINQVVTERLKVVDDKTSPELFKNGVAEQFDMNNIRDLNFKDIAQVYSEGGLVVEVDYEVRRPFIGNVDLVLSFKKRFDQKAIKAGE